MVGDPRLQRQRVDRASDLGAEDLVYEAMLLDAAASLERGCENGGAEMVAAAGPVLHLGVSTRYRGFDALLYLLRGWHGTHISDPGRLAILWKA